MLESRERLDLVQRRADRVLDLLQGVEDHRHLLQDVDDIRAGDWTV